MNLRLQTQTKTDKNQSLIHVPNSLLQRKIESDCREEECSKKRNPLRRKSADCAEPSKVPPIVHETLRSPGKPLDRVTRTYMESRFRHDFSRVRVHTDARAAESVRAVNASAYTVGRDVFFGIGHYCPQTVEGKRLLAHELTHVIQQNGSIRLQRAAAPSGHEEMLDEAINIVQQALAALMASAGEDDGQPAAPGYEERAKNLRTALDNLLALKGSGKEDEILSAVQPIMIAVKGNTPMANPRVAAQRKAIAGYDGDALEREAEVVASRVSRGYTADGLTQEVTHRSTEIIQCQGGPGEAVLVGGAVASGPPGWAILAGIAIVGLIAGGIYLATRPRARPCPPCPANPPPEIDRVPPSRPHFPCPGDHWHYQRYNQNPATCKCFLSGRLFGGCCGLPGAPC